MKTIAAMAGIILGLQATGESANTGSARVAGWVFTKSAMTTVSVAMADRSAVASSNEDLSLG